MMSQLNRKNEFSLFQKYEFRVSTGTQYPQIARIFLKVAREHENSTHFTEGGMQIARILGKDAHFFLLEIWGRVISDQV